MLSYDREAFMKSDYNLGTKKLTILADVKQNNSRGRNVIFIITIVM